MGLTGRGCESTAMSSQDEPQKYSYKFRLEAKNQTAFENDALKGEVQSYINELLGVKDKPREIVRASI